MSPGTDPLQLIAEGRLAEAARVLEQRGMHARAADLYEQLWDFPAASRAARAGGDLPRALDNLLQSRDTTVDELVDHIQRQGPQTIQACASVCQRRGAPGLAALLYRSASELSKAADCLEQAGLYLEAARCHEQRGEPKLAMELYRRQLDLLGEDARTLQSDEARAASFALGRILLRFGRNEEAVTLMQKIWRRQHHVDTPAGRALVAGLSRLGYERGARYALELIRRGNPALELGDCLDDPELAPVGSDGGEATVLSGRYRLGKLLGSGGMGRVYLASDLLAERQVAVKIFTTPGGASGRDAFRRFVREARITGQLRHPHIVELLDLSEEAGYMVLEHMASGTLVQRLRPRLDPTTARGVVLQVLSALTAAHQRGIIHRDIKPSNIFFSAAAAAKLGDFGVAHLQDSGQTQTGAFIGTLAYMSPEQIRGDPVTFATDIYALGVTLFQMLTGQLPFAPPDLVGKHLTAEPPSPSSVIADLPEAWDRVVLQCLAKEPHQRFDSLAELRQAIERLPEDGTIPVLADARMQSEPRERQQRATDQRFAVESTLHKTDAVEILTAQDGQLGRPVFLVRCAPGPGRQRLLGLLTAAASEGDEHLQRVLSLDIEQGQTVLQAPLGKQLDMPPDDHLDRLRLAEQLGLALASLHRAGLAHGGIAPRAITHFGETYMLLLTEALIAGGEATAADDVAAAVGLLGLSPQTMPADGAALTNWARQQQIEHREERRQRQLHSLLTGAMEQAPDGVADR